jgi:drug/metabolite transporter (DMT)-like permease
MDPFVFAAVLFAALCHASWNTLLKIKLDPFVANALITMASGLIGLALLPFVGLAAAVSWPWVAGSMVWHMLYYYGLTEAYRAGDLSQVYPIARGAAPLMTAVTTAVVLGEDIGLQGWMGILVLVSGVFLLSIRGGNDIARVDRRAVGFALFTAVTICGYSLTDGIGARVSGNALAYATLLFILDGTCMTVVALWARGPSIFTEARIYWRTGLIGGPLTVGSYGIAIWAMTVAPISIVAALRETSVLFAAVIAVVVLKEQLRPVRVAAALLIVSGLALIKLH